MSWIHTTATVLSIATFHLLAKPSLLEKLQTELRTAVVDETALPLWSTLEKLPYLGGVVLEALRLMYGVASRITLVSPDEDIYYPAASTSATQYSVPSGYGIAMSSYMIHMNPSLFPEPSEFRPERWLNSQGQRDKRLEKYLMSFSRGHRQCVGMQ